MCWSMHLNHATCANSHANLLSAAPLEAVFMCKDAQVSLFSFEPKGS